MIIIPQHLRGFCAGNEGVGGFLGVFLGGFLGGRGSLTLALACGATLEFHLSENQRVSSEPEILKSE